MVFFRAKQKSEAIMSDEILLFKYSVLIFAHQESAHIFGINFRAFSGLCAKLRENLYARKLVPLRNMKKENKFCI